MTSTLARPGPVRYALVHLLAVPVLLFAASWAVQHSAIDMTVARFFAGSGTEAFPARRWAWLDVFGHQSARAIPVLIGVLAFTLGLLGRRVSAAVARHRWALILLGVSMLLGSLVVGAMKSLTSQHCPVDIHEFGGLVPYAVDRASPFWAASPSLAGRCLPSGHAAGGYALLALYFAGWAAGRPAWRWGGLAAGIVAGIAFGIVRMLQGAHFASATLWSAEVQWTVAALLFAPLLCRAPRED